MTERAAHLVAAVLPWVPVRQWVLTVPYRLRYRMAFDHGLSWAVLSVFARVLLDAYARGAGARGIAGGRTGSITVIQRAGGGLNVNPHFHTLVLDGVCREAEAAALEFLLLTVGVRQACADGVGVPLISAPFGTISVRDTLTIPISIVDALDQPLVAFFPDYAELADPSRQRITLRHVLTMSAGLEYNESLPYTDSRNDEIQMNRGSDPIRFVLSRPVVTQPGQTWNYNGGLTQLLAAAVQRSTKQSLQA